MGSYLSAPITEKESESGSCRAGHTFGVSSMQGWRRSQEDAHIVHQLPNGTNVFGVVDGHGGREVSNFAKAHFAEALTKQRTYGADVGKALVHDGERGAYLDAMGDKAFGIVALLARGLRTHDDVQKLQQKKAARKERQQQRKREKRSGKRAAKAASLDQSQIDARKAKFAAKKARRLERKAAAS